MKHLGSDVALETVACSVVFAVLASLALCIHVAVHKNFSGRLGLDDWLTVVAFVITLALVAQTLWIVTEGQGEHVRNVTHGNFQVIAKSLLTHEELWTLVNMLNRLSALITFRKMFALDRSYKIIIYSAILLSTLHGVSALLLGALVCRPLNAAWDPNVEGICIDQIASFIAVEAAGLLIDIVILIIPPLKILQLNMSRQRQYAIILLLSGGWLVLIISALRIAALHRINSIDLTYDQAYLGLLSTLGALISVIATCVPSLRSWYFRLCEPNKPATSPSIITYPDSIANSTTSLIA